jgi:hypothetical protein
MRVEPVELVGGARGRDFVIYDNAGSERFSARLMDGSTELTVNWTDHVPWTVLRLRELQELAGGPGGFSCIRGIATDELELSIHAGTLDMGRAERLLTRSIGGKMAASGEASLGNPTAGLRDCRGTHRGEAMRPQDDCSSRRYWPFEVGEFAQRTETQEGELRFLRAAHQEGFQPYAFGCGSLGATADARASLILTRGRKRWEVVLGTSETKVVSAFVDDFDCAADSVLQWLRGADAADVLARVQDHLVRMPGAAHSFVLDPMPRVGAN